MGFIATICNPFVEIDWMQSRFPHIEWKSVPPGELRAVEKRMKNAVVGKKIAKPRNLAAIALDSCNSRRDKAKGEIIEMFHRVSSDGYLCPARPIPQSLRDPTNAGKRLAGRAKLTDEDVEENKAWTAEYSKFKDVSRKARDRLRCWIVNSQTVLVHHGSQRMALSPRPTRKA